jgi:hypothetical protein
MKGQGPREFEAMAFAPTDYLPYDFANRRHIGPSPAEMAEMLKVVGVQDLDDLIDQTVPASIRQKVPLGLGALVGAGAAGTDAGGGEAEPGDDHA